MTEKHFVSLLEDYFSEKGYLTKKELGVGYGIADLVLFKLNPEKCSIRAKNKQFKRIGNIDSFKIFDFLPEIGENKKVIIEDLISIFKISKSTLKYTYLKQLEKDGYIKKEEDKYYYKINGWIPMAKEIIAIEAKLKNWRRGIAQANRYKTFANKTYLAIPVEQEKNVNKDILKKNNIGLILFDYKNKNIKKTKVLFEEPINKNKYNLATEFVLKRKLLLKSFS